MDVSNSDMYGLEKTNFPESAYAVSESQSIPVYLDIQTYPCSNCGRCFNVEALRKHQPVCKKSAQKQARRIFDAGKQRATDSDVPYTATKETTQFYKSGTRSKADIQKKRPSNWREGHQALVQTIRQARQVTRAIETGAPVPKALPAQIPTGYVQCEFCQRHFNQYSAERHIPFCETQFKRKQMQYNPRTTAVATRNTNAQQPQTNSAPSTLASRRPQRTNSEKDYRRPPLNPNVFKQTIFNETMRNPTNGTTSKLGGYRMTKTRSAAGNYIPGSMRTGRTTENGDLNVLAGVRGQPKSEVSSPSQQRTTTTTTTTGHKTRSPSPARRPAGAASAAKHCHQCGEGFPVDWAKFCCECGEKRFGLE